MSVKSASEQSSPRRPTDDWFSAQIEANWPRLYRFIAALAPNRADCDDLLQRTCLSAWQTRQAFEPDRDFFPWLCGIARNHLRHYYRTQRRSALHLEPDVLDSLAQRQIDDATRESQRQTALTSCLEKLPRRQRDLLRQYYGSDRPIRSIADDLGRSPDAVYKALQRIRALLFACVNRTLIQANHP